MNIHEAKRAVSNGETITHRLFKDKEKIKPSKQHVGHLIDNNGFEMASSLFWLQYENLTHFFQGWEIVA